MIDWEKKNGCYFGHAEGEPDVAVCKEDNRWLIYTILTNEPPGKNDVKCLTWRPTLREAKERAGWAYLADVGGADEPYEMPEAA